MGRLTQQWISRLQLVCRTRPTTQHQAGMGDESIQSMHLSREPSRRAVAASVARSQSKKTRHSFVVSTCTVQDGIRSGTTRRSSYKDAVRWTYETGLETDIARHSPKQATRYLRESRGKQVPLIPVSPKSAHMLPDNTGSREGVRLRTMQTNRSRAPRGRHCRS